MFSNKIRESESTNIKIHINQGKLVGKINQHIALLLSILLPYPYNKCRTAGHKFTFAFLQPQRCSSQKNEYRYCFQEMWRASERVVSREPDPSWASMHGNNFSLRNCIFSLGKASDFYPFFQLTKFTHINWNANYTKRLNMLSNVVWIMLFNVTDHSEQIRPLVF